MKYSSTNKGSTTKALSNHILFKLLNFNKTNVLKVGRIFFNFSNESGNKWKLVNIINVKKVF